MGHLGAALLLLGSLAFCDVEITFQPDSIPHQIPWQWGEAQQPSLQITAKAALHGKYGIQVSNGATPETYCNAYLDFKRRQS
jgi:hypothetical protein